MEKPSLEELMKLAQDGDSSAYNSFLREVSIILRRYVTKKVYQPDDREDVVQEILLSIHKARHTYDGKRPIKPWIMAISSYRLNDYLRKFYKKKEHEVTDYDSIAEYFGEDVTDDSNINELLEVVNTLPEKQRKIVYMMKVEGYSVKEVAATMDMSESAVKVSAHRSYKVLREKIEEMDKTS